MKLATIALLFIVPMGHKATAQDYRELAKALRETRTTMEEAQDTIHPDCRNLSPEKTVRCGADAFGVSEEQAVGVWRCESNFGTEPPHTDAYHGPFQYLYSTYQSQQESIPDVVKWYELSPAVHDMRSNILTAVAWAARNSWSPWGCA